MEKKYLVLGGGGFVGSHLVKHLAKKDSVVRVFDHDHQKFQQNLDSSANIEFYQGKIEDFEHSMLDDITDVVYLIHATVPKTSMKDLCHDLYSNITPLVNFLKVIATKKSVQRFLYTSSGGTVYGDSSTSKLVETSATYPISNYGLSKLFCEHCIRVNLANTHIKAYIVRPSNAYGERQNLDGHQGAIGIFLRSLTNNKPITLYGDGGAIRDFIYVGDLVNAMGLLLEKELKNKIDIFNVGSGREISISELVSLIEKITQKKFSIERKIDRGFDCQYNALDISHISSQIKWRPETSLEDGIIKTWQWIQTIGNKVG